MEAPSGWANFARPKSEQWPKHSKSISKGKGRGQQRQSSVSPPQTRHDPDSVMSNVRSRIAKLEAAMVAGESDPTQERFMANLSAPRGAAGGPSGMTAEHLKVVLESERDSKSLWRMCQEFARNRMPAEILQVVRIGRMTALQKPQGGVRGIAVGDFLHRLVARTLAQQLGPVVGSTPHFSLHCQPSQDVSAWLILPRR